MDLIHYELKIIKSEQPLKKIAKKLAKRAKIICLDELFVNDIADAMILAELFKQLLRYQVCLVFTSNIQPDLLYDKGIQHDRFIPAIELIKSHCRVIHLDEGVDYRKRNKGKNEQHYLTPCDEKTHSSFWNYFKQYSGVDKIVSGEIEIHKRKIPYLAEHHDVIVFDFMDICNVPRSQKDYLAIAKQYHTVMIDHLVPVQEFQTNIILCLVHLIDVLYDNKIRCIIRADCTIDDIYPKGRMMMSFARTQSRLMEMQAFDWAA